MFGSLVDDDLHDLHPGTSFTSKMPFDHASNQPFLLSALAATPSNLSSSSDPSCLQFGAFAVDTACPMDIIAPRSPSHSIWTLPPELRAMIYYELLLSDSAFRLGHHGPYSHEKRRNLYPEILRTCRTIFHEASDVLYGDNTFFLGPIGHKPTYSASFITSIGSHNADKIRTLVAHCTHVASLNERYLRSWISSFGLNIERIKVLAVSFGQPTTFDMTGAAARHHAHAHAASFAFFAPPGGQFSMLTNVIVPGSGPTPPPANVVVGSSPTTTTMTEQDESAKAESEHTMMESRMQTWLSKASTGEVTRWISVKNTDLRAGNRWLLYVNPSIQALRSLRY